MASKNLIIQSDITDPLELAYALKHANSRCLIFRGHRKDPSVYYEYDNEVGRVCITYHKGETQDLVTLTVQPHKPIKPALEVINGRGD